MKRLLKSKPLEAIALEYRPLEDQAPRMVAKGRGTVAEKIIETARKAGVPVREDSTLVSLLSNLKVDQEIPPDAYKVVAELLAFVYRIHNQWKADSSHS